MKKFKMKKIRSYKLFIFLGLIFAMFTACIFGFKSYAYAPGENSSLVNNNITNFENITTSDTELYHFTYDNNDLGIFTLNGSNFTNFSGSFHFDYNSNISLDSEFISYIYLFAFTRKGVDLSFSFSDDSDVVFDLAVSRRAENLNYNCYLFRLNANNGLYFNSLDIDVECDSTYNRNGLWLYLNTIQFVGPEYPNAQWLRNFFNPFDSNSVYLNREFIEYDDWYQTIYNDLYSQFQKQLLDYEGTIHNQQTTINNQQYEIDRLTNSNRVLLQQLANANNDYNLNNLVWSIGGTPFETFKTIWNFEFFGVNISNLIFGLLTGLIIIWIIKKFFF